MVNYMKEIIAKEGMWLTQATPLKYESIRQFTKRVSTTRPSDWRDATDAEKTEWDEVYNVKPVDMENLQEM